GCYRDWSSDVCSSDLGNAAQLGERRQLGRRDQNLQMVRVLDLDGESLTWHADPERARRRHNLDVLAFPTDDQNQLERVCKALAELSEWNPDRERVVDVPARLGDGAGLRLDDPCH